MTEDYLTVTGALQYLKDHYHETITRETLYHWMKRGKKVPSGHIAFLKFTPGSCHRRIKREDLDTFYQETL